MAHTCRSQEEAGGVQELEVDREDVPNKILGILSCIRNLLRSDMRKKKNMPGIFYGLGLHKLLANPVANTVRPPFAFDIILQRVARLIFCRAALCMYVVQRRASIGGLGGRLEDVGVLPRTEEVDKVISETSPRGMDGVVKVIYWL